MLPQRSVTRKTPGFETREPDMNVLQINFSDYAQGGGGAIAMHRLYLGLKKSGVPCKILSGTKTLASPDSEAIPRSVKIESLVRRGTVKLGLNDIHCVSSFSIKHHPFYREAEIVNFHVIHSGFFNYLAIPGLTKSKPAVFTLHDMWGFTGHCAYSYDCERWKIGYGACPYPDSYPAIRSDHTHWEWKLKNWMAHHSNLTIVTLSRWLTEKVSQSMFKRLPVYHIPNGIDTTVYQPLERKKCRVALELPMNKWVLMFGAASLADARKGGDLLLKALETLPTSVKTDTILLTFGDQGKGLAQEIGMPSLNLGYVTSDDQKAVAYSAADLFIFPTRADNLPLVLQESMACGTPMVSFNVGGVPDLVRPGITGYLARANDTDDLSQGIVRLLEDQPLRERMAHQCRSIAVEEYALERQASQYLQLYQRIIANLKDP